MDPEHGVAAVLVEIQGGGTQGIERSAGHAIGIRDRAAGGT